MSLFYWLIVYLLRSYFYLFYRYRVYGKQHIYPGRAILASNHTSFLDPPLIGAACPEEVHFLARSSLFHPFAFKWLLKALNAHPVQGSVQDVQSFKTICQLLSEEKKIVIFPEGVRSEDGRLQSIKSGIAMLAQRMHSPIIPIYISGTFEAWSRHRHWPTMGTSIACIFGKPIFVDPYLSLNKKQAQEVITRRVQQALEELRAWYEAGAHGSPP